MVSSIAESMKNKPINIRFLNIGVDIERSFRFRDNEKRFKSFYNCAIEQLDFIIKNGENESYKLEAERIKDIFNSLIENDNKYDITEEQLLKYLFQFRKFIKEEF